MMTALVVILLGAALITALTSAYHSWEDIHDDSENEK
jgi:hypothetical protein